MTIEKLPPPPTPDKNVSFTWFNWFKKLSLKIEEIRYLVESAISAAGVASFNTRTGAVTLTSSDVTTALTYTPYNATNPAGYTSNIGTVTSVVGSGTVSGITLSGTVTTSGTIALSGTLAVNASNFASQLANTFLAAPNGAAGVPTFRTIAVADVPTLNQNTTGSAGSVAWLNVSGRPSNLSQFTNDVPYLTSALAASTYVELGGDLMTGALIAPEVEMRAALYSRTIYSNTTPTVRWWSGVNITDDSYHIFRAAGTGNTIIDSGNVGIGVTPTYKLHVSGAGTTYGYYANGDATGATLTLQDSGGAPGNGGQLLFGSSAGVFAGIKGFLTNGTGPAGDMVFQTRTTSGNVVERMRIDEVGNIGIGTNPRSVPSIGNPVTGANNLILYNAGNLGLTLLTDSAFTRTQQIGFGSQGVSLFDSGLKYDNYTRILQFWTNGSYRIGLDTANSLRFQGTGGIVLGFGNSIYFDSNGPGDPYYRISSDAWNGRLQYHHYSGHRWYTGVNNLIMDLNNAGTLAVYGPVLGKGVFEGHHVEMYGAVGNGTTDDTAAIQAAITAAIAGTGGSNVVIFSAKTYRIASGLVCDLSASRSIIIRGQGTKTRLDTSNTGGLPNDATGTVIRCDFASATNAIRFYSTTGSIGVEGSRCFYELSQVSFIQTTSTAGCNGIYIGRAGSQTDGSKYCVLKDLNVSGFTGNQLGMNNARFIKVENCTFTALGSGSTTAAVYMGNTSGASYFTGEILFHNSTFVGSGTAAQNTCEIYAENTGSQTRGIHFTDCIFYYGAASLQMFATASGSIQDIFVNHCQFDGAGQTDNDTDRGIYVVATNSATITGILIQGNYIVQWDLQGILCTMSTSGVLSNINIIGNYIGICEANAISCYNVQGLVVQGNSLFDCGGTTLEAIALSGLSGAGMWACTGNTHRNSTATRTATYLVSLYEPGAGNITEVICTGNVGHCITGAIYDNLTTGNKTVSGNWRRA